MNCSTFYQRVLEKFRTWILITVNPDESGYHERTRIWEANLNMHAIIQQVVHDEGESDNGSGGGRKRKKRKEDSPSSRGGRH